MILAEAWGLRVGERSPLGGCAAGGNIPAHLLSSGALWHRNIVGFRFAQPGSDPAKNKTDITIRFWKK